MEEKWQPIMGNRNGRPQHRDAPEMRIIAMSQCWETLNHSRGACKE